MVTLQLQSPQGVPIELSSNKAQLLKAFVLVGQFAQRI
jgi:hypothetical protein